MSTVSSETDVCYDNEVAKLEQRDSMELLLKSILLELRSINSSLVNQSQRIEELYTTKQTSDTTDSRPKPSVRLYRAIRLPELNYNSLICYGVACCSLPFRYQPSLEIRLYCRKHS